MLGIGSIFKSILEFILDKDNQRFILLILLAVVLIGAMTYRDKFKAQEAETERQINNIEALKDSVTTYRNEAGELTSQKLALQTDKEQLRTLNEELADEIDKEKGNVEYLSNVITRLRRDSVGVDTTIITMIDSDTYKLDWSFEEGGTDWYQSLKGYTQVKTDTAGVPYDPNTVISEQILDIKITTGITEDNGQRRIFVRSNYPYLNFTDIDGAILGPVETAKDERGSRWGIGLHGGYGYSLNGQQFSPVISVGLNYNIFEW